MLKMISDEDRKRWAATRLEARLWWCGDDVCCCYQPQIDLLTPNLGAGYPWIRREEVWRGTFISDPSFEELVGLEKELAEAGEKFGAPLT